MRLIEFTSNLDGVLNLIKKDCRPFLTAINNQIKEYTLYRGIKLYSDVPLVTKKTVRLTDRDPMSTNSLKHERMNDYFTRTFGEPFRNSMHASGSRDQAQYYGSVFMVFPIGNFTFLWSPEVKDIAMDIRWPAISGHINVPPTQEVVDEVLDRYNYTDRDLVQAIKSRHEIMIRCKEYYMISLRVFEGVEQ